MNIPWAEVFARIQCLSQELGSPTIDTKKRAELQKEFTLLSKLYEKHLALQALEKEQDDVAIQSAQCNDHEMNELYKQELDDLALAHQQKEKELLDALYPPNDLDDRSVFIEIRAGTGGQEAALFAADLVRMYTNYALTKNWESSLVDMSTTDLGGVREATLHIKGKNAYGYLKREGGVHRVQRVPKTETQGRVHTSTATVAVLPEAHEVEIAINPEDLRIDTYRSGGAGGQHVNKTDSAVRITHLPTGIVVACQDERSQHKNKAKAMKVLQSRILAHQQEEQEAQVTQQRREMVGTGARAEKVRTYNFPQNRVTDHQVDLTLKKLDRVIEGDLDEIVEALQAKDRAERKAIIDF